MNGRRGINCGPEIRRFVAGDYRLRLLRPKNGICCDIASSASSLRTGIFGVGWAAPRAILANYDVLRGWIGSIRG